MTEREASRRDVRWLQRRTNIADLLDDGVENGSDLACGQVPARESIENDAGAVDRPVKTTPAHPVSPTSPSPSGERARATVNWFGVLVGLGFVAAGLRLLVVPVDMLVYHDRVKRPSFVEHVTPERSRVYGAGGAVVGVGLLVFALYRPRR